MTKRLFKWDFKEGMTQDEFQKVLDQHREFLNIDAMEAQVKTLTTSKEAAEKELAAANEKLAPIVKKEREEKLLGLLPKTAKKELATDIIALANIQDDMDDEAIKAAFKDTIANREYLQATPVSTTPPKEESSSIFGNSAAAAATQNKPKSDIFD